MAGRLRFVGTLAEILSAETVLSGAADAHVDCCLAMLAEAGRGTSELARLVEAEVARGAEPSSGLSPPTLLLFLRVGLCLSRRFQSASLSRDTLIRLLGGACQALPAAGEEWTAALCQAACALSAAYDASASPDDAPALDALQFCTHRSLEAAARPLSRAADGDAPADDASAAARRYIPNTTPPHAAAAVAGASHHPPAQPNALGVVSSAAGLAAAWWPGAGYAGSKWRQTSLFYYTTNYTTILIY